MAAIKPTRNYPTILAALRPYISKGCFEKIHDICDGLTDTLEGGMVVEWVKFKLSISDDYPTPDDLYKAYGEALNHIHDTWGIYGTLRGDITYINIKKLSIYGNLYVDQTMKTDVVNYIESLPISDEV